MVAQHPYDPVESETREEEVTVQEQEEALEHGHGEEDTGKRRTAKRSPDARTLLLQNAVRSNGSTNGDTAVDNAAFVSTYNQAPLWSCVAVLTNNMLGAGVLGMPFALAKMGYVLGTIMLLLSVTFSCIGLHLLACTAKTSRTLPSSFYSVCHATIPQWTFVVDIAIAIKCFGVACSYLVVVAELMPEAVEKFQGENSDPNSLARQGWFWVQISSLILLPLVFSPSLTALKYTSTLSVGFVLFLGLITILYAVDSAPAFAPCMPDFPNCRGGHHLARMDLDSLKVFSIFIFAFTCHQNIFTICNELKDNTIERVNLVIGLSGGTACAVYMVIGLFGYYVYGDLVDDNLLRNYPATSTTVTVIRIMISLLVTFTFPLQSHPSRTCLMTLWESISPARAYRGSKKFRYVLITLVFLAVANMVGSVVRNLTVVLAIVGATGSTTVSYLLPGITYYVMHPKPHAKRHLALLQLGLGCVIIPLSLTCIALKGKE